MLTDEETHGGYNEIPKKSNTDTDAVEEEREPDVLNETYSYDEEEEYNLGSDLDLSGSFTDHIEFEADPDFLVPTETENKDLQDKDAEEKEEEPVTDQRNESLAHGDTAQQTDLKNKDIKETPDVVPETLTEVLGNLHIMSNNTQEPWPKDVKLFQPYEVEQILLPDNANCLAVQGFLKMCDLDFQVEPRPNAEAMSPSGKVPFIKAGAFVVSEMEPIVQFVNNKGISLTERLDNDQKSDMRAYMSLVHNVMEVAELYICWCDKETYNQVTSVRHGSIYPWPLNHIQNQAKKSTIIKKLKVLKWYNKTLDDVYEEVRICCKALTDRLGDDEFFFGDKPTELDALVFGHFFTILTTPLPNRQLADIVKNYPPLINLVQRIERNYFKRDAKD